MRQQAIDQRGLKTLVVWLLWGITSSTVLFMLYREAGAWIFIIQDHTHITQIILGLFLFGVLINFFHTCTLTMEWFRAYRLEKEIRKKGILALTLKKECRLVERITIALQHILHQRGNPDVESLLITSFSAQYRVCDFVLLIGNLLITTGLVGTVLGMTLTMTGLNNAMSAVGEDQRLVLEGVNHAMAGMGVAFYTTLLGSIFGGILLRVFAWITKASVESLQDMLMHTLLVYGAVSLAPSNHKEILLLEAHVDHLTQRTTLLQQALAGSRREIGLFREELTALQGALSKINSDDGMRNIAKGHAVFFRDARLHRGLFSFFKTQAKTPPSSDNHS